jgi:hypothetical protein
MSFAAIATFVLGIATCYMALLSRKNIKNAEASLSLTKEIEQRRLKPYCTVQTFNAAPIEDGKAQDYRRRFLGLPDDYGQKEEITIRLLVENSGPGVAVNLLLSFVSKDNLIQGTKVQVKEILGAGEKATVPVLLQEHKYPMIDNGIQKTRLTLRELIDHSHYIILEYSDVMGHKFHSKKPLVTAEFDKQDKDAQMDIPSSPVANETQFIDKGFKGVPSYRKKFDLPEQVKRYADLDG